jgi:hypothetical protein
LCLCVRHDAFTSEYQQRQYHSSFRRNLLHSVSPRGHARALSVISTKLRRVAHFGTEQK